jgi:Pentapeptide repeats (8 copies)
LTRANLDAANFSHAVLTDAQLVFADLEGTDFKGANLTGAVLGPHPNIGTSGGRRTSFRDARMDRRWTEAATAADVQGVIWNKPKALRKSNLTAGLTCGGSDVSAVKNPVYVSSSQGTDNTSCGASPTVACKSLAYALTRCTSNGCNVLAMYDQFVLPATLVFDSHTTPAGAQLYGGCLTSGPTNGLTSEIVAPSGGAPAVSIAGVKPVVLENFKILGSAATASKGVPAVTAQIAQGSQVTVTNSLVVGGQGGTGGPGAQQPPGTKGGDASQQTAGTNASCSNTNGGTGASEMVDKGTYTECVGKCATPGCSGAYGAPGTTPKWAAGGKYGEIVGTFCPPWTPNDGAGADTGQDASCGTGGTASTDLVGRFNGVTWSAGAGGGGNSGGNGGGGGGGGSGGVLCGVCFFARWDYNGSSGGGGGAGGCGGPPAPGGQQGGGSFGIVVAQGSVVTINNSRVVAGRSGDGGVGGIGGNGGAAGARAVGSGSSGYGYHGGKGGDGGKGGVGGAGGGGAGGNGGPSAAVALIGGAKVDGTGIVYYKGSSGNFGTGGTGGTSPACTSGPGGNSGVSGSVAEVLNYP